tara:strand:- start:461 stop:1621 length:1161 start_codon:yes stop_codon:yes gene_type:complete
MMKFTKFLAEEASDDKLKHLEHVEDHVIHGGSEGFAHAFHTLNGVHDQLRGAKNNTKITMKYDGSPSVVFGTHPETGKFFVGSKSVFNKNPKLNYTPEDIQKNHGHAPGLVSKLKAALEHLPKVHDGKGIYQADIMHAGDVKHEGHRVSYKTNTITYHHPADSEHAQKAVNSKLGVAVHTAYEGNKFEDMKVKQGHVPELNDHEDVHQLPIHHDVSKVNYNQDSQAQYKKHLDAAVEAYKKTPSEAHEAVSKHDTPIKTYINQTVRDGSDPSHDGFAKHYSTAMKKKVAGVKTDAAKARHTKTHDDTMRHVNASKKHIDSALEMHQHLQKAKTVLTDALNSHNTIGHEIAGAPASPEGYVVHHNGKPSKFVHRHEFSAANFARAGD